MEPRIIGSGGDGQAADHFGTAEVRRRVLDGWTAAAARFREDANAEEELALGGYRDRLVVELAQNAADAAARAGRGPGRLRLTLRDGVLAVANTGAPLDAAAVESLSTLRASSKRADTTPTVGRFGVGFAAVLAVSDEPAILGHSGAVRWSLAEARALTDRAAGEAPALAEELRRRDGHVPLLRLPLAAEGEPPAGYDTVVLLPLRDGAAEDLTRRLLDGVDDALLLTLPGLGEIVIEMPDGRVRTLTRSAVERAEHAEEGGLGQVTLTEQSGSGTAVSIWQTVTSTGALAAELLADRPVEERTRPYWTVTWAVPVSAAGTPQPLPVAPVLHAPTPSEEPLGLPALLIASYPLDSTRRHVAPGPLADFLTERAAEAYTDLLRARGADLGSLVLVPGPLGQGALDNALRAAVLSRLPGTAFLPHPTAVEEGTPALRPRDATLLEGADSSVVEALAPIFPGLLPAGLERRAELRALQVRRIPLAEVVDQLGGLDREPAWWRSLYGALAGADPEALGALPVPLATGRTVTGPRRVLLPSDDADWAGFPGYPQALAQALDLLDLRLAHPDAAHPLLAKLGATVATPAGVLATPELRAAVARSLDLGEDDFEAAAELADAVLGLVRAAGAKAGDHPWLARLALPDDEGELARAGELILPDGPLARLARPEDAPFVDEDLLERWGPEVLAAVGVLGDFVLVRAEDAVLDPDDLERLDPTAPADRAVGGNPTGLLDEAPDGLADWCEEVLEQLHIDDAEVGVPPVAAELLVVRDLDLVDEDAWPEALARLARPPYRDAVITPVRALLPDGSYTDLPPYTAWWLRDHPVLDGREPAGLRAAGGDWLLRGLYDEARTTLDEQFLHALGVRTTLAALLAEPHGSEELLDHLTDPASEVSHRQLHGIYTALAGVQGGSSPDPGWGEEHDEVRALPPLDEATGRRPAHTVVVDATEAVVADAPDLVQLLHPYPLVPVAPELAPALAERLHVSLASEVAGGRVLSEGTLHRVPSFVRELLPGCPAAYEEHEELLVVGPDGEEAAVDWRWDTAAPSPELPYDPELTEAEDEEDGTYWPTVGGEFEVPPVAGLLHAATPEGLAAGLAWSVGQWHRRFEVLAALTEPDRAYELSAARDFES
ncbi:molecular chaperone Hsp90 [Kitasatospora sp. NBC_01250]|uniref:sacsin N-terminal ATP-binding-like domain-containing protein n=1 Tax=unclassified Kitasatospora TaxID=2633591 RepID=UPI002E124716|nr:MULTISPECIES: molecular chaperone Hsp90 [unclassified Kitasatospora]WSJ68696.1 molecular chaperone Hsp90 [Kitasatospora sp. NBC_01302]